VLVGLMREAGGVGAQEQVVGFQIAGVAGSQAAPLGLVHMDRKRPRQLLDDLLLDGDEVLQGPFVAFRPELPAGGGVEQPDVDP
jgi:hypothetical protein